MHINPRLLSFELPNSTAGIFNGEIVIRFISLFVTNFCSKFCLQNASPFLFRVCTLLGFNVSLSFLSFLFFPQSKFLSPLSLSLSLSLNKMSVLDRFPHSTAELKRVKTVQFGVLSPDEIVSLLVFLSLKEMIWWGKIE